MSKHTPAPWARADLAEENARLRATLEVAAETISALSRCIGREDFEAEKRAMVKVDHWNRRLAYLRGDHMRGMVVRALEEDA